VVVECVWSFLLGNHAVKAALVAAAVAADGVVVMAGARLHHMVNEDMEAEDHLHLSHAVTHTVALLHLMIVTDMALGRIHLVATEAGLRVHQGHIRVVTRGHAPGVFHLRVHHRLALHPTELPRKSTTYSHMLACGIKAHSSHRKFLLLQTFFLQYLLLHIYLLHTLHILLAELYQIHVIMNVPLFNILDNRYYPINGLSISSDFIQPELMKPIMYTHLFLTSIQSIINPPPPSSLLSTIKIQTKPSEIQIV